MKIQSYKELDVWKKGIDIVDLTYEIVAGFPVEERYGLASQMQRCSVSIPANIAEGFARQYTKEYVHFCYISLGSCSELETHLIIARRRHYVDEAKAKLLEDHLNHECRMLSNLIKSLSKGL